jgi:hypothetical protein
MLQSLPSGTPLPLEIAKYLRENFGGFRLYCGLVIPPQNSILVVTTEIPIFKSQGEGSEVAFAIAPGIYRVSRNTFYRNHYRLYLETPRDEIAVDLYIGLHHLIDWRYALPLSRFVD